MCVRLAPKLAFRRWSIPGVVGGVAPLYPYILAGHVTVVWIPNDPYSLLLKQKDTFQKRDENGYLYRTRHFSHWASASVDFDECVRACVRWIIACLRMRIAWEIFGATHDCTTATTSSSSSSSTTTTILITCLNTWVLVFCFVADVVVIGGVVVASGCGRACCMRTCMHNMHVYALQVLRTDAHFAKQRVERSSQRE